MGRVVASAIALSVAMGLAGCDDGGEAEADGTVADAMGADASGGGSASNDAGLDTAATTPDAGATAPDAGAAAPDVGADAAGEAADPDASPDAAPGPDAGPPCDPAALGRPCSLSEGACVSEGRWACVDGSAVCDAAPIEVADEVRDGWDQDCDGTADEDTPTTDESCDWIDNDGDGRVDEGFTYVSWPDSVRTRETAQYAVISSAVPIPGGVALSHTAGGGEPSDEYVLELLDRDAAPMAEPITLDGWQPTSGRALTWWGDRVALATWQRSYSCGGGDSDACRTLLTTARLDGTVMVREAVLWQDFPKQYGVVEVGATGRWPIVRGGREIWLRATDAEGQEIADPIRVAELPEDEGFRRLHVHREGARLRYVVSSVPRGVVTFTTDLDGGGRSEAVVLAADSDTFASTRAVPFVAHGPHLFGVFRVPEGEGSRWVMARWALDDPAAPPIRVPLPLNERSPELSVHRGQVHLLMLNQADPVMLGRYTLDLEEVAPLTAHVPISYATIEALGDRLFLATADYMMGRVRTEIVGCPPQ